MFKTKKKTEKEKENKKKKKKKEKKKEEKKRKGKNEKNYRSGQQAISISRCSCGCAGWVPNALLCVQCGDSYKTTGWSDSLSLCREWLRLNQRRMLILSRANTCACHQTENKDNDKDTEKHSTTKKLQCTMPSCRSTSEPHQIIVREKKNQRNWYQNRRAGPAVPSFCWAVLPSVPLALLCRGERLQM